ILDIFLIFDFFVRPWPDNKLLKNSVSSGFLTFFLDFPTVLRAKLVSFLFLDFFLNFVHFFWFLEIFFFFYFFFRPFLFIKFFNILFLFDFLLFFLIL